MKKHQTITKTNHKTYKKYDLKANRYKFYKGRYIITFYDKDDEFLVYMFDTIKDILIFQKKEINSQNIAYTNLLLYLALKKEKPTTRMLNGELMNVHIIDILDENI